MKLSSFPRLDIDDKDEYIKSLETSVKLMQKEIESLKKHQSNKDNSSSDTLQSIFGFHQFDKYQEILDLLHNKIKEIVDIFESAILFKLNQNKFEILDSDRISEVMKNNIKGLIEEGILDWASNLTEVKIIPNLNLDTKIGKYFLLIPLNINKSNIGLFITSTNFGAENFNDNLLLKLKNICENATLSIKNIQNKTEINSLNNKLNHLQSRIRNSSKILSQVEIAKVLSGELEEPIKIIEAHIPLIKAGVGNPTSRIISVEQQLKKLKNVLYRLNEINKNDINPDKPEKLEIKNIVDEVLLIISSQMKKNGISIKINYQDENLKIRCYKSLLEQLFIEIFLFQRDRMPDGGIISVNISNQNKKISIVINDNGVGLILDKPDSVFDPFNENGYSELYLAKQIVEQHKGKINFLTDSNTGNSFKILFPDFI